MVAKMIQAKNLSFFYDEGTKALDNIDFFVNEGEFVGILASNGGGKTTLLKTLVGLLKPQQGDIFIEGKAIKELSQKLLYQKIGFVFQNPNDQLFCSTVSEDIAFGPNNLGLSKEEIKERVKFALELTQMYGLEDRPIHHLSFGQQKRVCIAGVLAMKPKILILDEPTAGLDPKGELNLMHLLNKLNKENKITIIMATHMIDLLPLFIDRIYVLNKGRIFKEGTPLEVFSDPAMIKEVHLRLPYITHFIEELRKKDGLILNGLPLTIGEARRKLVELLPKEIFRQETLITDTVTKPVLV